MHKIDTFIQNVNKYFQQIKTMHSVEQGVHIIAIVMRFFFRKKSLKIKENVNYWNILSLLNREWL